MSKTEELFEAIYSNNIENVKIAWSEGVDISSIFADRGYTPLMAAAATWKLDILDFLIDQGADVKVKTPEGDTVLSIMTRQAFSQGRGAIYEYHGLVMKVVSKGVDIDSYNQNTDSNPLLSAMSSADIDTVEFLVDAGADLNIIVSKDNPDIPLNRAISIFLRMKPSAEYIFDKMIAKGAKINPEAENLSSSPLASAVSVGKEGIFNKLIEHGADINHPCSTTTPLISAVLEKNTPMTYKLVEMGAHINPENAKLIYSPLSAAISVGDDRMTLWLMNKGANLAPKNVQITPVTQAIASDNISLLDLMLSDCPVPEQQIIDGLLWNIIKCGSPSFNLALSKVKDVNFPSKLLVKVISGAGDQYIPFAKKLIIEHNAKFPMNAFNSLKKLAYGTDSNGIELMDLILKNSDDQSAKLKGMNLILEDMLRCTNGVNIKLLETFINHGLIITPSNVQLAHEHQHLSPQNSPDYIPKMLQLVFQNQEKVASIANLSLSSTGNENLGDDHSVDVVGDDSEDNC